MDLSAPMADMGHTLDSATRPNNHENVSRAGTGPRSGTATMAYTKRRDSACENQTYNPGKDEISLYTLPHNKR